MSNRISTPGGASYWNDVKSRHARGRQAIQFLVALCSLNAACGRETPVAPDQPLILEVSVSTSGGDPDNAYQIVVGSQTRTVGPFGSTRFALPPGSSTVQILDVAQNCTVKGEVAREVDVRTTTSLLFEVACDATGLDIQLRAEGADIPVGFTITFDQVSSMKVAPNSSFTMTRMQPGVHEVKVDTPYKNCIAPPSVTVDVPNRVVKRVDFSLTCQAIERPEMIAYTADPNASDYGSIEAVGPDGQGRRRIVSGARNPTWSPDGKSLAYESWNCNYYYYWYYGCLVGVSIIDPETRETREVTTGNLSSEPAWSPKGDVIAVSRFQNTRSNIYLLSLNGQSTKVNVDMTLNASGPAWSPNGDRLAFFCVVEPLKNDICIANRDGTGFLRLTTDAHAVDRPAWSPDGEQIAFTRYSSAGVLEIALISGSGGTATSLVPGFDPSWSRDGSTILFSRDDGIFTISRNGGDARRLTTGNHGYAAWRK